MNCLTVFNLKLDDVFGKSYRSITNYILGHPSKAFAVAPFVGSRCKTPVDEIQADIDGAISPKKAVKLLLSLAHIDEIEAHRNEIEQEIQLIAEPFFAVLDLHYILLGLNENPMTYITILSEIGLDM